MKKFVFVGIAVVLVAVIASGFLTAPSDELQIRNALNESTKAAREGRPSPVLEHLSKSFTYGGENTSTFDIAKAVKQAKPEITIMEPRPTISGETATVVSPVGVRASYLGLQFDQTIPRVTIELKKEVGFKWLIVPEPRWRITSVSAENLPNY